MTTYVTTGLIIPLATYCNIYKCSSEQAYHETSIFLSKYSSEVKWQSNQFLFTSVMTIPQSPWRGRDGRVVLDWMWLTDLCALGTHTCAPRLNDAGFSPIWKTNPGAAAACFGISRNHRSPKTLRDSTIHSELTFYFTLLKTFDQFCRQTNWLPILFLILFYLCGYF